MPFDLNKGEGEHGTLRCHVARANPVWQDVATATKIGRFPCGRARQVRSITNEGIDRPFPARHLDSASTDQPHGVGVIDFNVKENDVSHPSSVLSSPP
ncbi:FMN-binding negative transcriptional regulator [Bradyrhizobium sp. TZ2]